MARLEYEPRLEVYDKLLKYALKNCDAFMLVLCNYYKDPLYQERVVQFEKKLEPLLIKSRNNRSWPGTEGPDEGRQYKINFYRCHPSARESLFQPLSLYNWLYPYFPEDLCFFIQGYCWLRTTAHEEIGEIFLRDEQERRILQSMGIHFLKYEDILIKKNGLEHTCKIEEIIETYKPSNYYEEYHL